MKIKIREKFFETNSSSTHAIIFPKGFRKFIIPQNMDLYLIDNLNEKFPIQVFSDKISFLLTILYAYKSKNEINYLINILKEFELNVNIIDDRITLAITQGKFISKIHIPYIDNVILLIRKIIYNEELLLKYLFGPILVDYDLDSKIFDKWCPEDYFIITE